DACFAHGRTEQQSEGRIRRQRIVLLRGGESKKDQDNANPAKSEEPRPSRAIDRPVVEFESRCAIDAPGKQPKKMQEPEPEPGHRIVVTRIPEIEESKQVLIDEVKPKEAVILARSAVHGEREVRRVPQRRQYVPRDSNRSHDDQRGNRTYLAPCGAREQLTRNNEVYESGAYRK